MFWMNYFENTIWRISYSSDTNILRSKHKGLSDENNAHKKWVIIIIIIIIIIKTVKIVILYGWIPQIAERNTVYNVDCFAI